MVITGNTVMEQIREELRRLTGHNMDQSELSESIKLSVLRPEAL
jgi:hypothetical protein